MAWSNGQMAVAGRAFVRDENTGLRRNTGPPNTARSLGAVIARFLGFGQSNNDNRGQRLEADPAVELDCLNLILSPSLLRAAEQRGIEAGTGADHVLIRWGIIDEENYLRYYADHAGLTFENFSNLTRANCILSDARLVDAVRHGIVPFRQNGIVTYVYAPCNYTARRILNFLSRYPELANRFRITSRRRLSEFLERHCGDILAHDAAEGLADKHYDLSAAPITPWRSPFECFVLYTLKLIGAVTLFTLAPKLVVETCGVVLALWFLLFTSLRLAGCFAPQKQKPRLSRLKDDELPIYTVLVALYREASSVAPLMRCIDALDYPREKLDVRIIIEPDDLETRAALARFGTMPHVQVMIAPNTGPRTKPKALNSALAFASGTFVTVFDAEDRPEPGQLRKALDVFRSHGKEVACAQASLCIDNTSDGWLPRMFTAEYAGQFDVFLQGFSSFEMPLPLGGSSNHFRTSVLRAIGGWDPYNVTEDADLGFRLARFKYRSVMFPSTTYEEAPSRFGAWLRQRSRWMKGWMQTWGVHMRSPLQLWRDAGARGFFTLNIIVGGNVLTALAHPILLSEILFSGASQLFEASSPSFLQSQFAWLHLATIGAGYLSTIIVGVIGLYRRNVLHEAWVLLLTPIYWICLSVAAWRALYQLLREPYRWEKTEHGLAQSSRIAAIQTISHGVKTQSVRFRNSA